MRSKQKNANTKKEQTKPLSSALFSLKQLKNSKKSSIIECVVYVTECHRASDHFQNITVLFIFGLECPGKIFLQTPQRASYSFTHSNQTGVLAIAYLRQYHPCSCIADDCGFYGNIAKLITKKR